MISSEVNATFELHTLDDSFLPSANWMLELLDDHEQLKEAIEIPVTLADIKSFQEQVTKKSHTLRRTFLHIFLFQTMSY